jgi:hypothetical protein
VLVVTPPSGRGIVYVDSAIDVTTPPPASPPPGLSSSPPELGVLSLLVAEVVGVVCVVGAVVSLEADDVGGGSALEDGGGRGVVEEAVVRDVVVGDADVEGDEDDVEVVVVDEEVEVLDEDDEVVVLLLNVGGVGSSTVSVCIVKIKPFSSVVVCVRASGAAPSRRARSMERMLRRGNIVFCSCGLRG